MRRARKSIASFKVREGMPVGISVTLRRARMWEFLDRLCSIAVPRIRDFRGLNPRSFDGRGNYSMGVKEQLIFPEIDYDSIDEVRGLDITITTTAATDLEAFELLLALGMPFAQEGRPGSADEEKLEEEEEEKRKEEARLKAEAEQAALEQLKEENPDAYAKPEPEEGRGGRGEWRRGRGRRRSSRASRTRRIQTMAKTSQKVRQGRKPKFKTRGYSRCRRCGRPRAVYRKFGLCRICLREAAHEGYVPGMTKSSW